MSASVSQSSSLGLVPCDSGFYYAPSSHGLPSNGSVPRDSTTFHPLNAVPMSSHADHAATRHFNYPSNSNSGIPIESLTAADISRILTSWLASPRDLSDHTRGRDPVAAVVPPKPVTDTYIQNHFDLDAPALPPFPSPRAPKLTIMNYWRDARKLYPGAPNHYLVHQLQNYFHPLLATEDGVPPLELHAIIDRELHTPIALPDTTTTAATVAAISVEDLQVSEVLHDVAAAFHGSSASSLKMGSHTSDSLASTAAECTSLASQLVPMLRGWPSLASLGWWSRDNKRKREETEDTLNDMNGVPGSEQVERRTKRCRIQSRV